MLKDLTVIVTGALGRIGTAFCEAIVANNGRVIMTDIASAPFDSSELFTEENSLFVETDITVPQSIDEVISRGVDKFGVIGAAVHCAYPKSSSWGTPFEDLDASMLNSDLAMQLGGAIMFSQRVLAYFMEQNGGHLIHVSSIQGVAQPKFDHYAGTEMMSPIEYSAIKSGIIAITKYLAKYYRNENIRVNCISPGGIMSNQPESFLVKYKTSCNSKGMLDPQDISGTLIYLLSEFSTFVTGQNLIVDDGWIL